MSFPPDPTPTPECSSDVVDMLLEPVLSIQDITAGMFVQRANLKGKYKNQELGSKCTGNGDGGEPAYSPATFDFFLLRVTPACYSE